MALISCPDCSQKVSDSAPQCLACGRPIAGVAVATTPSYPTARYEPPVQQRSAYACTGCGSEQSRKLSVVHAGGLSEVNTRTGGVGVGLGGIGVGSARTRGTQQTALSQTAAPPEKKSVSIWLWLLLLMSIGGMQTNPALWVVIALGIGAYIWHVMQYNRSVFPKLFREWDRKYMCDRCGLVFSV